MKNLRIYSVLLALVCVISAFADQNRVQKIREKLLKGDTSSVIVASHRGDWRNFSENTLEGLDGAIAMGVDIVELDLQMTKDSVIIVMHDPKIDRTTTGKGKISELTLDSIRKVKLKNGCNIRTQQRVPTLEEYLNHAKGKVMLNLDKADRYFPQVVALTEKTGTTDQIVMKGNKSYKEVKELFGPYIDKFIYMPIVKLDNKNAEKEINKFLKDMHPVAFELLYVKDSNPLPMKLKDSLKGKSLIWYNTLWDTMAGGHDDDASLKDVNNGWGYLIDQLGATIIQTDRPQMLIEYLRSRNLHD